MHLFHMLRQFILPRESLFSYPIAVLDCANVCLDPRMLQLVPLELIFSPERLGTIVDITK